MTCLNGGGEHQINLTAQPTTKQWRIPRRCAEVDEAPGLGTGLGKLTAGSVGPAYDVGWALLWFPLTSS